MGERAGSRQPNVVVVLADDMGWGDLGCYGAEKIPTPAVDRVAREGVRATDCHSASALCTPSRYALLTGQYALDTAKDGSSAAIVARRRGRPQR